MAANNSMAMPPKNIILPTGLQLLMVSMAPISIVTTPINNKTVINFMKQYLKIAIVLFPVIAMVGC